MSKLSLSTRLACMVFVSFTAAGCLVEGTVRDAATGEPIAGASVGTEAFQYCDPFFEPRVFTDEMGRYRFIKIDPRRPVMARASGYLDGHFSRGPGEVNPTRDFDLPFIGNIEGEWDVVFTFDAGGEQDGNVFDITQEGLALTSACGSGYSDEVEFDFDGTEVVVEGNMGVVGGCDVVSGMMEFHLTLGDSGDTLTGPFSLWGSCFSECEGSGDWCRGTLVATRRLSQ